jgi:hypothetical protein
MVIVENISINIWFAKGKQHSCPSYEVNFMRIRVKGDFDAIALFYNRT